MTTSWASANELKNIEKVQGGWFLSDENLISLANFIQELQDENARLLASDKASKTALQEERIIVELLLEEKDKIINLQSEQIKELKFVYKHNDSTLFDKATLVLGGAGVAAIVLLIAQTL